MKKSLEKTLRLIKKNDAGTALYENRSTNLKFSTEFLTVSKFEPKRSRSYD